MIIQLNLSKTPSDDLISHDKMMIDCVAKVDKFSMLSVSLWSEVLKEMSRRNLITLVSGSFDDVGNAAIVRNYPSNE